jgi:hypothetical protein
MATAFLFEWRSVSAEQFRRLVKELHWEEKAFSGRMSHPAGARNGSLVVLEVWSSPEAFELFWNAPLRLAVLRSGLPLPVVKSWKLNGGSVSAPLLSIGQILGRPWPSTSTWQAAADGRLVGSDN